MPPLLQVPNNFKFKCFFGGWILEKVIALDQFVFSYALKFSHMGEQKNQQ
jgi:hypothetical protein